MTIQELKDQLYDMRMGHRPKVNKISFLEAIVDKLDELESSIEEQEVWIEEQKQRQLENLK